MAASTSNTYNPAGQLTQTVSGSDTTEYSYDGAGDELSQEELSGTVTASATTNSYNSAGPSDLFRQRCGRYDSLPL